MGGGAVARDLPPELPVMAALVESGLAISPYGDADCVGFFQMRERSGTRASTPAIPTGPTCSSSGSSTTPCSSARAACQGPRHSPSSSYGQWIADVERPAAQYRDRYQLRLSEAR